MELDLTQDDEQLVSKFRSLSCFEDVANLLEISADHLAFLLYKKELNNYDIFFIPKKQSGCRMITAPKSTLKIVQRKLNYILKLIYEPKPSVQGFSKGRSIVTNAKCHARKKYVLNIDLLEFFPSINFGRVWGMFQAYPYNLPPKAATVLAKICTYKNQLPQGAPTSPIIANMICYKMDRQLVNLASKLSCYYTRYADDISISTFSSTFPRILAEQNGDHINLGPELKGCIIDNGFTINENKVRLLTSTSRQEVTGLTVNKFPNVSRRFVRQIRAMLHAWEKYGLDLAEKEHFEKWRAGNVISQTCSFAYVVKGKLDFLRMVRGDSDEVFRKLAHKYNCLAETQFPNFLLFSFEPALWIIEDEEECIQGTAFMLEGIGLVTCAHCLGNKPYVYQPKKPSQKYYARVVASSKDVDLAILEIDAPAKHYLSMGDPKSLVHQTKIKLVGYPNWGPEKSFRLEEGAITGFDRRFGIRRVLISASIISGNSGGPVLDYQNRVIGVAQSGAENVKLARETDNNGVILINEISTLLTGCQESASSTE